MLESPGKSARFSVFYGGDGNDTLNGSNGAADDLFVGGAGNDTINGNNGNDLLIGGGGNDTINGGGNTDTVSYADAIAAVTVNLATTSAQNTGGAGTDTISNCENLIGCDFNDTLTGSSGANVIEGGAGNDTIEGAAGNDTLIGGAATDTASYANAGSAVTVNIATTTGQNTVGAGTDTLSGFENLRGSAYNDTLTGDGSANVIEGGAGNDTINGGGGSDFLYGGAGTDTLTGSTGGDVFLFEAATAFGAVDTITDFSTGASDMLNFADLLDGYDYLTDLITDFVEITTSGSNSIVKVDADGGANNFVQIATLQGITGLTDEAALEANGNLITV